MRFLILPICFCIFICIICCGNKTETNGPNDIHSFANKNHDLLADLFDDLLAEGFSYPFGDGNGGGNYTCIADNKKHEGWYIATKTGEKYSLGIHTGEDWNGKGGGNTDFDQPVYSTARGKVIAAKDFGAPWGNVIYMEHHFIENAKLVTVYSLYAHLNKLSVKKDEIVTERQKIGTIGTGHNSFPAHLHFEIRKQSMKGFEVTYWPSNDDKSSAWVMENYFVPSDFIDSHRKLKIPSNENFLVVAQKSKYKIHIYNKGKELKQYEIALSQEPLGHKQIEGDLKLPEGEYYITEKNKGPFSGAYKAYFGPAWFRISYPNIFDAENAYKNGNLTKARRDAIVAANKKNQQPPSNTGLGGGIGIHGWAGEWPGDSRHLTWGCISMKNKELENFYDLVPVNARIFILP